MHIYIQKYDKPSDIIIYKNNVSSLRFISLTYLNVVNLITFIVKSYNLILLKLVSSDCRDV